MHCTILDMNIPY